MIRPRPPGPGARVALISPAGPVPDGGVERAVTRVREMGWEPVLGLHAAGRRGYLSGSDEERLGDLESALAADVDVVWFLRGGYGTMRIVERVTFGRSGDRPPPAIVGFSDNTVLHLGAFREGVPTFHGPHAAVAQLSDFSTAMLMEVLRPEAVGTLPMPVGVPHPLTIAGGAAEGELVGGNLSLLAATVGTPYEVRAEGRILFLEEVGEPAYRVDRLLSQLLLAGVFRRVAAVAVGAISDSPHPPGTEPGPAEIIHDRLAGLGVPIVSGLPFGHVPLSWTLPLGVRARLDAATGTLALLEPAVLD